MFRDETEAALARAEAAERELAELKKHGQADDARIAELERAIAEQRAELARLGEAAGVSARERAKRAQKEQKEREKEERRRRSAGTLGGRFVAYVKKESGSFITLGMFVAAGIVTAAILFGMRACGRHQVETRPGSMYQARLVRTVEGQVRLLVVSEAKLSVDYAGPSWRLDLVDPASGQRLVRRVFERTTRPEVLAADRGRFWCESSSGNGGRLELRDVPTLGVAVSWEAMIARSPVLATGLHSMLEVDGWSGNAVVTVKDGTEVLIEPGTARASPLHRATDVVSFNEGGGRVLVASVEAARLLAPEHRPVRNAGSVAIPYGLSPAERQAVRAFPRLQTLGSSQDGTTNDGIVDDARYSFVEDRGSHRRVLQVERERAKMVLGEGSFLSPELVSAGESEQALVLPERSGFIIEHTDSMDRHAGGLLLSALSLEGKLRWTLREPPGRVALGFLHGDLVVLAISGERSRVLGIAWRDGSVRWRYDP